MERMKCLRILFKLVCFLLAGISICYLFHRWLKNDDASSFDFKKYNDKEQHVYPTYSFCFHSTGGGVLFTQFETEIMQNFLLHKSDFEEILKGQEVIDFYGKFDFQNLSDIRYEEYMLKLEDILIKLDFLTDNEHDHYSYDSLEGIRNVTGKNKERPFYISHVDPAMICFSRKSKYVPKLIRKRDAVLLNLEKNERMESVYVF